MNGQDLIKAGFRRHGAGLREGAECLFQKRFRNADGDTLYFIEVFMTAKDSYEAEVQLYGVVDAMLTFDVEQFSDVEAMERYVAETHSSLGCGVDPHN
jgi:hypothetical protein